MIPIGLIFILVLLAGTLTGQTKNKVPHEKWVVMAQGKLSVQGKTNLNAFTCEINGYTNKDTLSLRAGKRPEETFYVSGKLRYPVDDFKSGNAIMTRELKKTLNSAQFPQMTVQAVSLERIPDLQTGPQTVKGMIEIELRGATKRFPVICEMSEDASKQVYISCQRSLNFSDFNIEPPRRLGGLLKTRDELLVRLSFAIRPI